VWAIARRHNIRPVLPEYNFNRMAKMFDRSHFNIPTLRSIGIRCNLLTWILEMYNNGAVGAGKPKDLFRHLQVPRKQNLTMIIAAVYAWDSFHTVPLWNELDNDLVIRKELRDGADQTLKDIRRDYYNSLVRYIEIELIFY
jgi:hypothetical protein